MATGEESDDDGDASISAVTTNQSLVEEANKRILIREGSELEEQVKSVWSYQEITSSVNIG